MKKEIWVNFSKEANLEYEELQKKAIEEKSKGIENSEFEDSFETIFDDINILYKLTNKSY